MLVLTGNALGLFFSEYTGFPRHHHSILENPLNFPRLKNSITHTVVVAIIGVTFLSF